MAVDQKLYNEACEYIVKNQPDWATEAAIEYAPLYLKHGRISAAAREAKKAPPTVGAVLQRMTVKYNKNVKGKAPAKKKPVIRPAKRIKREPDLLKQMGDLIQWAQANPPNSGETIIASTPLGDLIWKPK